MNYTSKGVTTTWYLSIYTNPLYFPTTWRLTCSFEKVSKSLQLKLLINTISITTQFNRQQSIIGVVHEFIFFHVNHTVSLFCILTVPSYNSELRLFLRSCTCQANQVKALIKEWFMWKWRAQGRYKENSK